MTKVIGPLFSFAASGTYRGELVFRTKANGTHVARLPRVTAPRSPAQLAHADNVAVMSQQWKLLDAPTKAAWAACGATFSINGYQLWWREWIAQGSSLGNNPVSPC